MSDSTYFLGGALLIRCATTLAYPLVWRHRRRLVKQLAAATSRTVAAEGAWKAHRVVDLFSGLALCGAPWRSAGGPGDRSDCRACNRIYRKATALRATATEGTNR